MIFASVAMVALRSSPSDTPSSPPSSSPRTTHTSKRWRTAKSLSTQPMVPSALTSGSSCTQVLKASSRSPSRPHQHVSQSMHPTYTSSCIPQVSWTPLSVPVNLTTLSLPSVGALKMDRNTSSWETPGAPTGVKEGTLEWPSTAMAEASAVSCSILQPLKLCESPFKKSNEYSNYQDITRTIVVQWSNLILSSNM